MTGAWGAGEAISSPTMTDAHQPQHFERREGILDAAALPQSGDVEHGEPHDHRRRHDRGEAGTRLAVTHQGRHVVAHQEGEDGDRPGLDHRHPRPGAEEARPAAERPAQKVIFAPRVGIRRRQLGVTERAQQRDQSANHPEREEHRARLAARRHQLRRAEDAGAEHQADDEDHPVPGAQHRSRRRSVGAYRLLSHVDSTGRRDEACGAGKE